MALMRMRPETAARILLFVVVALLCFWKLGTAPLNETDEGFAANRAASFFRHHTFLVSFDDLDSDAPQFRKPPALYWAVAVCLKALGWNLWAVRLPTALAGFGCGVLFYLLSRRALGEWVAQLATLAFAVTPFVLWHIRTAMLELPLLFLILSSVYFLVNHPDRAWAPAAAGMAGAAAILLKGGAGVMAPVAMTVCAFAAGRPLVPTAKRVLIALLMTVLPLAVYLLLLSPELRTALRDGLVLREGAGRISRVSLGERLGPVAREFLLNMRWQAPAAACGLVLMLIGLWRNPSLRRWAGLALVLSVPIVLLGAKQVVPYARYFLPVYPFAAALAAHFCFQAVEKRWAALLLIPFAIWSALLEPGLLRWIPVAAAAAALAFALTGFSARAPALVRGVAGALLFLAVLGPSWASARVVGIGPKDNQRPLPEVARLAQLASERMAPGEKMVVGSGFTVHTALFYSRRALLTFRWWLCHAYAPGASCYGLFMDSDQYEGLPALRVEEVGRDGPWRLVHLTAEPGDTGALQLLLADRRSRPAMAANLDLLEAGYRAADRVLIVTSVVQRAERVLAEGDIRCPVWSNRAEYASLTTAAGLEWTMPSPVAVCGVNLVPVKRQEMVAQIAVEAWSRETDTWREVARVNDQPDTRYDRVAGRLVEARGRVVRIRFAPVATDRLRLVKLAPPASRFSRIEFLVSDQASPKEHRP